MEKAYILSKLIEEKGLSRRAFAEEIGIPATTLQSMITRGVGKASVDNVIKVCRGLGITTDDLERMAEAGVASPRDIPETIAAHFDGEEYTEDELEEILKYAHYIKSQRK
nr:helix-turn-helix transcriptional regulator [Paenibacillus senegalimassiliensis]